MSDRGVVAVDIGGSVVKAGLVTSLDTAHVQMRVEFPTGSGDAESSYDSVLRAIREVEKRAAEVDAEIAGYGITAPGPTDRTRNLVTKPQLGWSEFPLRDRLAEDLDSQNVIIQNDANAAAFGCWWHTGKWDDSLLLVTVSTGVGGGFVLAGGRILNGATGNGAELGHMPFGDHQCAFEHGIGCIEGSLSGSGIRARFGIDPREATREIRATVAYELGTALVGAVALYDPGSIQFMGSVAYGFQEADERDGVPADEQFLNVIGARIREVSLTHREVPISLSPFGDDTGIIGAAALALREKH